MSGACAGPCESAPASRKITGSKPLPAGLPGLDRNQTEGTEPDRACPAGSCDMEMIGDRFGFTSRGPSDPAITTSSALVDPSRAAPSTSARSTGRTHSTLRALCPTRDPPRPIAAWIRLQRLDPPSTGDPHAKATDRIVELPSVQDFAERPPTPGASAFAATHDASVTLIPRRLDQAAPPAGRPTHGAAEPCTLLVPTRRARRQGPGVLEAHESRNEPSRAKGRS
jgi:hypothetical protein